MTAEGHCNIVWGGDFKDTLRFQTSNVSFSFDATFRFADYTSEGWKMQILKEKSIDVTNQQRPVYRGIDNFYQKS